MVRGMPQFLRPPTTPDGHHQRISHELAGHAGLHRPTQNASRGQVQHHRNIQPAFSRPDVGKVGHPLAVRRIGLELAVKHVVVDSAALAKVFGQASATRPCAYSACSRISRSMRCRPHSAPPCQHVMPYAPCKDTKLKLKGLKRQARMAFSMEDAQRLQQDIRRTETDQRRQRQDIFAVGDEIEARRDALIATLQKRLHRASRNQSLFVVRWSVV